MFEKSFILLFSKFILGRLSLTCIFKKLETAGVFFKWLYNPFLMLQLNKNKFLLYIFIIVLTSLNGVLSAQPTIDSIKATKKNLKTQLDSITFYRSLANGYLLNKNIDSGLLYGNLLVNLYEKNNKINEANRFCK